MSEERARRFPMLLDSSDPEELEILQIYKTVKRGEAAALVRTLLLMGHADMQKDLARGATVPSSSAQESVRET